MFDALITTLQTTSAAEFFVAGIACFEGHYLTTFPQIMLLMRSPLFTSLRLSSMFARRCFSDPSSVALVAKHLKQMGFVG